MSKLTYNTIHESETELALSADKIKNHFANVGLNTTDHLPKLDRLQWKGPASLHQFKFCNITSDNITKLDFQLGMFSSLDILRMDCKLLCLASHIIAPILRDLFNLSLFSGTVPSDWKHSRVSPVYKNKGDVNEPNNYRPISVSCHVAKIFEKQVQAQLVSYMVNNDFISLDQSA